ncbi:hypothetical protein [Desulforamulus aquiferis]|uniref:Uncharacterized protein n=1 Tax=Desulforamulus aquiferis TaxID=1397668 RepID=A0AAW7ZC99_9FIRM|nr:hypothetical protein [Desulforamulus aquiferis]MDO7787017.1 hypothetical protein [Desulforamulus aquiferis]
MKINFTKKQFRTLLDLVYAGNMVINSTKYDNESEEHEELQSYIFSFCKDYGFEELVEFDRELDKYYETREYEESGILDFIDEYDDYIFWDQLVSNLARRDANNEVVARAAKPSAEVLFRRSLELEKKYSKEFEKNGLENVKVLFTSRRRA